MRSEIRDYLNKTRDREGLESAFEGVIDVLRDYCKTQDDLDVLVSTMQGRAQSFSHDEIL